MNMKRQPFDYKQIAIELKKMFPQIQSLSLSRLYSKGDNILAQFCLKSQAGKQYVWVKINKLVFTDKEKAVKIAEETYNNLIQLSDKFSDDTLMGISEPLGYIPAWAAIVSRQVDGVALSKVIYKYVFSFNIASGLYKKFVEEAISRCAAWLVRLQKINLRDKNIAIQDLAYLQPEGIEKDLASLEALGGRRRCRRGGTRLSSEISKPAAEIGLSRSRLPH